MLYCWDLSLEMAVFSLWVCNFLDLEYWNTVNMFWVRTSIFLPTTFFAATAHSLNTIGLSVQSAGLNKHQQCRWILQNGWCKWAKFGMVLWPVSVIDVTLEYIAYENWAKNWRVCTVFIAWSPAIEWLLLFVLFIWLVVFFFWVFFFTSWFWRFQNQVRFIGSNNRVATLVMFTSSFLAIHQHMEVEIYPWSNCTTSVLFMWRTSWIWWFAVSIKLKLGDLVRNVVFRVNAAKPLVPRIRSQGTCHKMPVVTSLIDSLC